MKGQVLGQGGVPRQGDNVALAHSMSGGILKLRAPAGIYDGTDDNVTLTQELALLALNGKRVATGTLTTPSGTSTYSGEPCFPIFINKSLIPFTPSLIIAFADIHLLNTPGYFSLIRPGYPDAFVSYHAYNGAQSISAYIINRNYYGWQPSGFTNYVSTTQYFIPFAKGSVSLTWIAVE